MCVPCVILPVLLFLWHKFLQPIVLAFWNPWKPVEEKNKNTANQSMENEKNINNCLSGKNEITSNDGIVKTDKID